MIRWAAGVPDRALIGRTLITLGAGADVSIVEELVESGPIPPVTPSWVNRCSRGPWR